MTPAILAIGKALPQHSVSQNALAASIIDLMQLSEEEAWIMERIYKNSSIEYRYSVVPDIMDPKKRFNSASQDLRVIGMTERNEIYKKEAPCLAEKAAQNALQQWGGLMQEITHVISVSCTGIMSPGIEYILAQKLQLEPGVSLLGINFMGCFGAFKAIKVASKIAKDNPKNRILLVSTELCTLHFKPRPDIESTVIQSLFADGSAAVVIGCHPNNKEKALFFLSTEKSYFIKDTMQDMVWDASDEGFEMRLSQKVPAYISMHIETFVNELLGNLQIEQCEWAIHPGGKTIVEVIEKTLSLDRSQSISSWNVLKNYGNLSSATFLYVLEDILSRDMTKKTVIGLGFGPGLSIEGLILQKG